MAELQDIILLCQQRFGENAFTADELDGLLNELELDVTSWINLLLEGHWIEPGDHKDQFYLSPSALDFKAASKGSVAPDEEAMGLGRDLEQKVVGALEEGAKLPWGKVALAMWVFFLFMVAYAIVEVLLK